MLRWHMLVRVAYVCIQYSLAMNDIGVKGTEQGA